MSNNDEMMSAYEEQRRAIEQLNKDLDRLMDATVASRDDFTSDVNSYKTNLSSLEESPSTTAFIEHMTANSLNISSILEDYETAICEITDEYR